MIKKIRNLGVLIAFIVLSTPFTTYALLNGLNGFNGPFIDVRAYGAKCDSSTDDSAAFSAAYTSLTGASGGTIMVPAGKTCMINSDVQVESNVNLLCNAGGTLKLTASPTISLAMFSWFNGAVVRNNSSVEGCTFDLSTKAKSAVFVQGTRNNLIRNRFINGITSTGSSWNMVSYSCTDEQCNISKNYIACASTVGAKDVGISATFSGTPPKQGTITDNIVKGCDITGISVGSGDAYIANNSVSVTGTASTGISAAGVSTVQANQVTASATTSSSSIGIDLEGANSNASNNRITVSGDTGLGVKLNASYTDSIHNKITVNGVNGTAIHTYAAFHNVTGNSWLLTSATAGSAAVGAYMGDGGTLNILNVLSNNIGNVTTTDSQVHIIAASTHLAASSNVLTGGAYCIAPSQASATEFATNINVIFSNNRCYTPRISAIIATTGWIIHGNYLAWIGNTDAGATSNGVIQVGDARTLKVGTTHLNITGNLIHSGYAVTGIKFNDIGKTCNGGSKQYQACTNSNTTDCPGATCGTCCVANSSSGVQITGNHLLLSFTSPSGPGIDFGAGMGANTTINNIIVGDNNFDMPSTGSNLGMKCSASNQGNLTNVVIGVNEFNGNVPANGDSDKGRLDLNCTPSMVRDLQTEQIWVPAAGCNGTTGYPIFDLPSSSTPSPVCVGGSAYPRGALSYANAVDTSAYTSFLMPKVGTYQFFVKPVYQVNASNTLSTRWVFSSKCDADGTSADTAFPGSGGGFDTNMDIAYNNTANTMKYGTFTTIGNFICNGDQMFSLKVKRLGTNSTAGQDDQSSASLLLGTEIYMRKQD